MTSRRINSIPIVHGADNVTFDGVNKWSYKMSTPFALRPGDEVSMTKLATYYSWFNISAAKGNNYIGYYFPDSGGEQVLYQMLLPDGIYSYNDISNVLREFQDSNGHFLVDSNGNNVYYLSLVLNGIQYALTIACRAVPVSLPTGWTNPNKVTLTGTTPQFIIASGSQALFGLAAGTYPSEKATTDYIVTSTSPPQITDHITVNVSTNIILNDSLTDSSQYIANFSTAGVESGALITCQETVDRWYRGQQGLQFNSVFIALYDQLGRPVKVYDPSGFACTLAVKMLAD